MLEKLQKELDVTDVSPQESSPIICKDQEKGLHDIVEADKIGWLGNIVSTEGLNKSTTVSVK
jgi:hypothetical protein